MRVFVIKQDSDLQSLAKQLVGPNRLQAGVALDRLKSLNPHVDFARLDAGTVLLVPDHPDFEGGDAASMGADAFDGFARDATAGLKAAGARIRASIERQDEQRKEVGGVFKSAMFKRLAEADETLRRQAADVESRSKAEAKRAAESLVTLEAMDGALRGELEALAKLLK